MAFDSDQQRTLLFGGHDASGKMTGDTWQWDGITWVQVDDTGPPGRQLHGMAYAADRKRTVLFGGTDGANDFTDTWEWDGTRWTHVQDIGPDRVGMAIAFTGTSVVMFGGLSDMYADTAALVGDTWEWDGQHWVERQDMGPQARWRHAMAFDSARSRLVLFGGESSDHLGDTWETSDSGSGSGVVKTSSLP
jgi:hypothetical protein